MGIQDTKNITKVLFVIYLISVCMGFLFVLIKPLPYTFVAEYEVYARNILSGHGYSQSITAPYYPNAYRTPGYALFLCLIYKIFGINNFAVMLTQVLLNATVPVLIFYITRRYFSLRFAYLASFMVAVYPFTTIFVHVLFSEILCIFLFTLGLFLFEEARHTRKILFFSLSGITFGYCLLVRPGIALFPLFITIAYLFVENVKRIWKYLLIFNFCVVLVWTPWVIRNYWTMGRFIPLALEGTEVLHGATVLVGKYFENKTNNPKFINQSKEIQKILGDSGLTGLEKDMKEKGILLEYALKNIKDNPFSYILNSIRRIPRMWISMPVANDRTRSYGFRIFGGKQFLLDLGKYFMIAYLLFAIYGIWILRYRLKRHIFLLLPLIYFPLTHMFLISEARITLPARPYLIIFALIGLLDILKKSMQKIKYPF